MKFKIYDNLKEYKLLYIFNHLKLLEIINS